MKLNRRSAWTLYLQEAEKQPFDAGDLPIFMCEAPYAEHAYNQYYNAIGALNWHHCRQKRV